MPCIVRYPPFHHFKPGSICHSFATVMDIMPTLLDLAGTTHPNAHPSSARSRVAYRGHPVYPMRGKSWCPYLRSGEPTRSASSEPDSIHGPDDPAVGWEMFARASLRKGKYKIVNIPHFQPTGTGGWQLYDLSVDPGEIHDLAKELPEVHREMILHWGQYQEETGTVFGPPIKVGGVRAPIPKDTVGGDPTDDQLAWARVGVGKRLVDPPSKEGNGIPYW